MRAILPAYFSDPGFSMPDELQQLSYNQDISTRTYAALGVWDFTAEVSKLTQPVLMLWGEDDPFGLSLVEATKSALSSAVVELVIIERCGHFWHERQDALLANVRSFLKKVSA